MNQPMWEDLVDVMWDDELTSLQREIVIKYITGFPSHWKMVAYTGLMRTRIRNKMVELNLVQSLEEMEED